MHDDSLQEKSLDGQFAEVLAEILQAEELGKEPDLGRYLDSFPALEPRLRAYFRDRRGFERLAAHLAPEPVGAGDSTTPHNDSISQFSLLSPGMRFGGYEILKELGCGGMGVVYQARQIMPDRMVALKVIRTDRLQGLTEQERRQWIDRFHREAQLVAGLDQQQHIVTLYEVGDHEGQPYFTMQLVPDGSLAQRLRTIGETNGASAEIRVHGQRDNARLLAQAARAVEYAHRRGVLHRDLKPGNILLDANGLPLVSDFGLARRLDETGSLVASDIEGTIAYMAPEQARGAKGAMTTAVDVYSLGAILYELLTGRPPFTGPNQFDIWKQVLERDPVSPRQMNRRLSLDLETICLKCLNKEPGRRYPSAIALAEDLENWLEGRPINARPVGKPERLWRWCQRNPVPTFAALTVLAIAVVTFILIADSRNKALALADEKGQLADANFSLAEEKGKLADEKGQLADTNFRLAEEKGKLADDNASLAKKERDQKEQLQKLADKNLALAKDKSLLADEEHKQRKKVEWQLARETVGRGLDLCDRGEVADGVIWLGRALDLAGNAEAADLERAARLNLAHWIPQLHPMRAALKHNKQVTAAAFSPDGRTVLTVSKDGTARLWNATTGQLIGEPMRHPGPVWAVCFSPDGKKVVTGGEKGAYLWDAGTAQAIGEPLNTSTAVWAVAIAADSRTFLTTSIDSIQLWVIATGKPGGEKLTRGSRLVWPRDVAFRPDGKAVVMVGADGMTHMWDAVTGKPIGQPLAPAGINSAAAFSPDGRLLLTWSPDRMVRLWEAESGKLVREVPHPQELYLVAFAPDSRTFLTTDWNDTARLWDSVTGKLLSTLAHRGRVFAVAFSPDGRALLTGSGSSDKGAVVRNESWGEARLWDVATGAACAVGA
jgi:serine/threonine protein kinase/WD40 repeat protein